MGLSTATVNKLKTLLVNTIRRKLESYDPETSHMPFHHRLLGKDRYAMFSFIQSMNTTFGMSIWEQMAEILAEGAGNRGERQYELLGEIDEQTEKLINEMHYKLRKGESSANKNEEIIKIRRSIRRGDRIKDPDSVVDFYTKIDDQENYFDITSAKPNIKDFVALKLKLLRWTALRLSQNKRASVFTRLAIPYNPYHPEPYERWTLRGLYDLDDGEILIGADFWNFVACDDIYEDLLDVFQAVGSELKEDIDERFSEYANSN